MNTYIPNGWVNTYFGEITYNFDFKRIPLSSSQRKIMKLKYDYYGATGVIGKVDNYIFDETMLLITEDGSLYGNNPIAFLAHGKYWVNNHAHIVKSINITVMTYLKYYLNSISISPYVTGTVQLKLNQKNLNSIPIVLPPEKEQLRIIKQIELIFKVLE